MSRTIILGMGNKLFGDDGVGIVIAEGLRSRFEINEDIDVVETNWGGFRIIDILTGYDSAVIIDAIRTQNKPIGFIHQFSYSQIINSLRMVSYHDINFATAIELAKRIDIPIPNEIKIYGIEIGSANQFVEKLSDKVQKSVEKCIELITTEIQFQKYCNVI